VDRPRLTRRIQLVGWVWLFVRRVPARNVRSPGARVMRIHLVDARSGGPVALPSGLIAFAVEAGWTALGARLYRPINRREQARAQELTGALDALRERYPKGSDELREASGELVRARGLSCAQPFLLQLPRTLGLQVPALWSRRNQTLVEWISATVVIVDER
jgi:hypothetical protein